MREGRAVIDAQGDVAIFTLFVSRDAPAYAVPAPALLNLFFFSPATPGAPIVINDSQLWQTIAQPLRCILLRTAPRLPCTMNFTSLSRQQ